MISYTKNFTKNVELAVDSFVKQHYYKQYMDSVYTYGMSLKMYLAAKQNAEDNLDYKNLVG